MADSASRSRGTSPVGWPCVIPRILKVRYWCARRVSGAVSSTVSGTADWPLSTRRHGRRPVTAVHGVGRVRTASRHDGADSAPGARGIHSARRAPLPPAATDPCMRTPSRREEKRRARSGRAQWSIWSSPPTDPGLRLTAPVVRAGRCRRRRRGPGRRRGACPRPRRSRRPPIWRPCRCRGRGASRWRRRSCRLPPRTPAR